MRKFTLFFFLLLFGAISFAQQPVVTPVWDQSVNGTADWSSGFPMGGEVPSWMGATTERGMALHDSMLYIVSRKVNPPVLVMLDVMTGDSVNAIQIDTSLVKGGTFAVNDIAITPSGKILIANLSTNSHTQPFKVYMMEENEDGTFATSVLLEWSTQDTIDGVAQPALRLGDGFAFWGDVSEEENGYIIVADATATEKQTVFRWNVLEGVAETTPVEIDIAEVYPVPPNEGAHKFGTTPRIFPLDNDHFWADGHATYPALYNMEGEMLSTFSGEQKFINQGISGVVFFTFKERDFILGPTTSHANAAAPNAPKAAFQLFEIPEAGAEEADSIAVFPERGLGDNTNASYAAPMAVDVQEDQVMMYIMSPNNGVAAFSLTIGDQPPGDVLVWNISDDQFKDLGSLTQTTVVDGLTIYAAEGKNVDIDANNKELEEWTFTHRLKLGGSGTFDEGTGDPLSRVLAFDVPGNSKITIALQSSSSSEDRVLNLGLSSDSILVQVPALGQSISKGEYDYVGDSATIYLFSPSSGVNIYLIMVEPLVVSAPITDFVRREYLVYPNPAFNEVFVDVDKPMQIAIYNTSGILVRSKLVESKHDPIKVNDLAPGMYIIRSQMTNDFSRKLIIR